MAPASSADPTVGLLADARALHPDITDLRHRLHREPEVGLHLPRTQERVLAWLDGLGFEISTGIGTTSLTAVLRGGGAQSSNDVEGAGQRPAVLLRGDMDARQRSRGDCCRAERHPGAFRAGTPSGDAPPVGWLGGFLVSWTWCPVPSRSFPRCPRASTQPLPPSTIPRRPFLPTMSCPTARRSTRPWPSGGWPAAGTDQGLTS